MFFLSFVFKVEPSVQPGSSNLKCVVPVSRRHRPVATVHLLLLFCPTIPELVGSKAKGGAKGGHVAVINLSRQPTSSATPSATAVLLFTSAVYWVTVCFFHTLGGSRLVTVWERFGLDPAHVGVWDFRTAMSVVRLRGYSLPSQQGFTFNSCVWAHQTGGQGWWGRHSLNRAWAFVWSLFYVLKSVFYIFLSTNIQSLTHPVVNVAIHLDNVHSFGQPPFPSGHNSMFLFEHT